MNNIFDNVTPDMSLQSLKGVNPTLMTMNNSAGNIEITWVCDMRISQIYSLDIVQL